MEESSGEVLWSRKKDEKVAFVLTTKMVIQILILESTKNGKLSWDKKMLVKMPLMWKKVKYI